MCPVLQEDLAFQQQSFHEGLCNFQGILSPVWLILFTNTLYQIPILFWTNIFKNIVQQAVFKVGFLTKTEIINTRFSILPDFAMQIVNYALIT